MRRACKNIAAMIIGSTIGLIPIAAGAQECSLRLSEFEAATEAYGNDISGLSGDLSDRFASFKALEAEAVAAPDECPAGIASSRSAATSLVESRLAEQSDPLLDCGYFFSRRVLSDIERARANNDSQLILRLGEVQQRIFDVEQSVIEATKQATFLQFRAQGLVREHDALQNRCSVLGDIYD